MGQTQNAPQIKPLTPPCCKKSVVNTKSFLELKTPHRDGFAKPVSSWNQFFVLAIF